MAYEKQTWNTGDVITAEKLNHMEEGIGSEYDFVIEVGSSPIVKSIKGISVSEAVEKDNAGFKLSACIESHYEENVVGGSLNFHSYSSADSVSISRGNPDSLGKNISFILEGSANYRINLQEREAQLTCLAVEDDSTERYDCTYDQTTKEYTLTIQG